MTNKQISLINFFAMLVFSTLARSQVVPDAGIFQREIESSRPKTDTSEPSQIMPEQGVDDDLNLQHYLIKSFDIQGATLIDRKELLALVQNAIGQSLSARQLQALGQRLSDYYREHGWLVRVYFPEQDLSTGEIRIEIIESRYGGSELKSEESRADSALVRDLAVGGLAIGEALDIKRVESGILKANDLPGIQTTAVLEPGAKTGETRLKLKVSDLPLITGNLNYTNQGIRATGSNQYQGNLYLNDLLGRGDQFSVQALGSENLVSVRGEYGWLLGDFGTRLSIYGSHLQFQLGGSFASVQAEGEGRVIGGAFSQTLLRQMDQNLYATVTLENRLNQSSQLGTLSRQREINTLTLSLKGDKTDHWLSTARNFSSLQVSLGHVNHDLASDKTSDALSTKTQGDFVKFSLHLSRSEYLNENWKVVMDFNGQWADKNLDSSQKFSLGGPNGVRAYPVNEAMGDSGWLLNIELQRHLGYGFHGVLFSDTGLIEVNKRLWSGAGAASNCYLLSGVGIGLRWNHDQKWQASAMVGLPVTTNPERDRYNQNSDGTRAGDPAGWLSLTRFF